MRRLLPLQRLLRRFGRDESGTGTIELLLVVPMMTWVFMATLVYFDAYRTRAMAQRASLTIADMYSRETDYITPAYLGGTKGLLQFLMKGDTPSYRVTAFDWADSQSAYRRIWSRNRGTMVNYTNATLNDQSERLPQLDNGEVAILVETEVDYSPPFAVGLFDFTIKTFTVTSPRFATKLCWNSTPDQGEETEIC